MTKPRVHDCFLYSEEDELLSVRLKLLADVVDRFVIVWSRQTFTGLTKARAFPYDLVESAGVAARTHVVELETLRGKTAWEKEAFSRNAIAQGLSTAAVDDLIIISDIDEIPRPAALARLVGQPGSEHPVVLGLDYYNFKFNYKLVHGLQALWAGPVVCPLRSLRSPQELRSRRWALLEDPAHCVEDGGWHFSYLTATADVQGKLASFSHQESATQSRKDVNVNQLIANRLGFHDHTNPGSVWAVVSLRDFDCEHLERLVSQFPGLLANGPSDDAKRIHRAVRRSVRQICDFERAKILGRYQWSELFPEILRRFRSRLFQTIGR